MSERTHNIPSGAGAIRFLIFAKPHLSHASIHHKTLQGTIPARPDLLINPVMNNQFHLLLRYARSAPDPDLDFEQIEERLNCPEIGISSGKSSGTLNIKHNQLVEVDNSPVISMICSSVMLLGTSGNPGGTGSSSTSPGVQEDFSGAVFLLVSSGSGCGVRVHDSSSIVRFTLVPECLVSASIKKLSFMEHGF